MDFRWILDIRLKLLRYLFCYLINQRMETIIFYVTLIAFVIPLVNTSLRPLTFQIKASSYAKENGWPVVVIVLTRALPFLTLYTQFWILIAMYYLNSSTMFIAQTLSISVFLLYHGINLLDPMYLAWHPKELVYEVVRLIPPWKNPFHLIIWVGLHLQHTIFPFYLFFLANKHDLNKLFRWVYLVLSSILLIIYILWHLFCWHVQGIPAYPFLVKLRAMEYEVLFYILGIGIFLVINISILYLSL